MATIGDTGGQRNNETWHKKQIEKKKVSKPARRNLICNLVPVGAGG